MNEKKHGALKGYLLTVVGGLAVMAGVLFLILQYRSGLKAMLSIYGSQTVEPGVSTIWVIVISALAGPVFMMCCWWLVRGICILFTVRRAEKLRKKDTDKAVSQAKAELQAAVAAATPAATPERESEFEGEKESST